MKPYHVILAAIASVTFVGTATAAAPGSTAQSTAQASRDGSGSQQAHKDREICIRMALSGTRMPKKVCRTAAEWEADGGVPTN